MKIMFWNTNRNNNINEYIAKLIREYNIDILVLAEYTSDSDELITLLFNQSLNFDKCTTIGCERITLFSTYDDITPSTQDTYYSIQIIQNKYILCCVHLMSDLYSNSNERLAVSQQIMRDIEETEKNIGSQKTIIIGDFNEMPYDLGCLNANGFHGLPVYEPSNKTERIVNGISYRKFYNPMWNFMGDFSYPPGTYYLNNARLYSPMWYLLDQVILSTDVMSEFKKDSLQIITKCSYFTLTDKNGHPNKKISDHFPIMCEVEDYYNGGI